MKSWEIKSSYLGLTSTRLPSSRAAEIEPRSAVFLIDGDPATIGFAGRPDGDPRTTRSFVRITFPAVTPVHAVVLVPAGKGKLPVGLLISAHCWERWDRDRAEEKGEWKTVFEEKLDTARGLTAPVNSAPNTFQPEAATVDASHPSSAERRFTFPATRAREIWISSPEDMELAEIKVIDAEGRNVASLAAGATVTVSRPSHLFWFDQDTQRYLWQLNYDLGVKWARVSYYLTPLIWPYVERSRGAYQIDPETEQVIRDAARNGLTITLTLGPPDNPLYASEPPEARIKAFCDYVRFMVRRFKGSVQYFEILNEYYNQDGYPAGQSGPYQRIAKEYSAIAIPAAHVIREESKDAKIIMSGPCPLGVDWILAALAEGLSPLVDVVAWHPYQLTEMPESLDRPRHPWAPPEVASYEDAVHYLQRMARAQGFHGTFQANEAGAYAIHRMRSTALVSAKYMARTMVLHSSLQVPVFWNEAVSLMRPAWQPFFSPGQPEVQPDYSYYVLRTLSALMDGMEPAPAAYSLEVSAPESGAIERHLFTDAHGRLLLALWRREKGSDVMDAATLSVTVKGFSARRATGFEIFNGEEQELEIQAPQGETRIRGLQVRDYPLLIVLER